jgi:DNA ligase-1
VFAFDLLYINGESLVKKPLYNRQGALRESFSVTRAFQFAASMTLKSYDEPALRSYLEKAVAGGAEGLMIKLTGEESEEIKRDSLDQTALSCVYESGARSQTWLKVKRDYVSGYADTIDVVPIGAWYGNGRKAQKGFLSPVLLAVYDDEEDVYRSISRCMSFTDAMYEATREFYFRGTPYPAGVGMDESLTSTKATAESDGEDNNKEATESADETLYSNESDEDRVRVQCYPTKPSALINTNENPPIWFKPSEVWEVSFADLTLSLQHTAAAGLVHESRGVALRFPRFKRRRPDKQIDQATTSAQIAELFSKQSKQGSSGGGRK